MAFAFGKASEAELVGVHPTLVEIVRAALRISTVDFGVHDGLRRPAEQQALVAAGASWTMNSRHCKGPDGWGHAVDLVPYVNGKLRWEWGPIYTIAAAMAQAAGERGIPLRWGGVWDRRTAKLDWNRLPWEVEQYGARRRAAGAKVIRTDGPHFELPKSLAYP